MRFTKELPKLPQRCIYLPQIGSGHEQGFIVPTVAFDAWDNRFEPAVSIAALQEIARQFPQAGLSPRSELVEAQAQIEALKAENEALKEDLKQADQVINAIDVLEGAEFRARKKPGRKPAAKAA